MIGFGIISVILEADVEGLGGFSRPVRKARSEIDTRCLDLVAQLIHPAGRPAGPHSFELLVI